MIGPGKISYYPDCGLWRVARTVLKQIIPLLLAPLAILLLHTNVAGNAELLLALLRHPAREDPENVAIVSPGIVAGEVTGIW